MKSKISLAIFLVFCILVMSCGRASTEKSIAASSYKEENAGMADKGSNAGGANNEANGNRSKIENIDQRKLIKEGSIRFETDNISTTTESIKKGLKNFKAFTIDENQYDQGNEITYTLTIKVPSENFDLLLDYITRDVKKIDNKSVNLKDVTEEFIDIQARLKTKKEIEQKYLDLLKQANSIEQTLSIEKQLGEIRGEIESIEGRLKFLESQVSYSTLTVSYYQSISYSKSFFNNLLDAIQQGWQVFLRVIVALTYLWVLVLIFFIGRFVYLRFKKK